MDVVSGFSLLGLGGIVTFVFFVFWFKAMENEDANKHDKEKNNE